ECIGRLDHLIYSFKKTYMEIVSVQLLLSQGARSDMVGSKGVAAIHLAVGKETEKNTRCLKLLLQHGADPNVRSSEGLTPLHIAAVWGCYQNLKVLLMNGGNPNLKDNEGNTPGQLAEQQENRKCAQLLQENQASSGDTEDDDLPQFQYCEFAYVLSSCLLSDMDSKGHPSQDWSNWADGPSMLSSTRMSAVGPTGGLPILKEHDLFADDGVLPSTSNAATSDNQISPSRRDTLPALHSRLASRKSVSFRDVDEYFPVFSPEHPKQQPPVDGSPSGLPFELSEYSNFLDSERMATVLHRQGIDVTSPDHVYVFCRESSESTEEELEKTVISHCALEESDDEKENENLKDVQVNMPEQPGRYCGGSSSSGTTSSHYSSCDSDHYTSDGNCQSVRPQTDLKLENEQNLPNTPLADDFKQDFDLSFTPSPFVTGRTRSRLSRCSLRTSRTPESIFVTSLFEETLPTPVRTWRQTPRSQNSENFYNSPHVNHHKASYLGSSTGGDCLPAESQDTQSSTLGADYSVSFSQADTLILPKSGTDPADDVWITEDCSSQPESVSSSSSSSYFSPRRSREDSSDLPCTPGTGCTPRYSMSRLSSCRRPQHLANLSYTPGGRPHIQDLDEPVEYLYTDTEQGHKLIEIHIPPTETILYDWRSIMFPETKGLTDRELRLKLKELGESPGPISSRTRPTYMRRLCQTDRSDSNSPELCRALQTFELPSCQADEQALCEQFDQPDQNRKWREGIIKSSFNYLLLDPRVTKNLPFRSQTMTPQECFQTFIHSIFYVGKGKRSRPYSHLYEALEYYKGDKTAKKLCPKVQHILQVWNAEQGVISLHCFQNVIPVEAYTREASMVEAIGLKKLTNQKRGDFYGVVSNWQLKRKRELGVHLLYKAMQIFLAEGERQLRPADIRQ
uniref:Zgc:85936 n=1 Tax=Sphaeramia orbicularis TaxID=375764 RepID=A0A673CG71_9TELE